MNVKVDTSPTSAVGICGCGRRCLATSHERALERLVEHERTAHPADANARAALAAYRDRLAKRAAARATKAPAPAVDRPVEFVPIA